MLQFRSQRSDGRLFEGGRKQYLAERSEGSFEGPRICNVIENTNAPLSRKKPGLGFPWMTMVLGSGCLDARDATTDRAIEDFPALLSRALEDEPDLPDGSSASDLAEQFARSLVQDRTGREALRPDVVDGPSGPAGGEGVDRLAADVVLAAALLTRFYHQAKATTNEAINRSGNDEARLDPDAQAAGEIVSATLDPLLEVLDRLADRGKASKQDDIRMLASLVEAVQASLGARVARRRAPRLRSAHVQLLTELAWYFMTSGTTVYPGWSDLMFLLSMRENPSPVSHSHPRPKITNISQTPDWIIHRLEAVTEHSWATLHREPPTNRDRFYHSAARVLLEQARYRRTLSKTLQPPLACAFVTSFDLELEMALWTSVDAEPFVVAVPVHLLVDDPDRPDNPRQARTCWLGCVVRPDHELSAGKQLARLRDPGEWFLLSDPRFAGSGHAELPIVVRLNGCPLIALPPLTVDGALTDICTAMIGLFFDGVFKYDEELGLPLDLRHAVLIDEYAAMQQAAVELFVSPGGTGTTDDKTRYGLPEQITDVPNSTFARFWSVLGVQIGDSSVRYRLATQVASPAMLSGSSTQAAAPKRAGVVVNRRSDAAVLDLLYWYGFDVVVGECEPHRQDFDHYVRHLQAPTKRAKPGERCPLDD